MHITKIITLSIDKIQPTQPPPRSLVLSNLKELINCEILLEG